MYPHSPLSAPLPPPSYAAGTMEVEPLDPEQRSVYADPKNLYYPRGQEELNNGPPAPHCPRAVMLRNATAKLVYRSAGEWRL